MILMYHHVCPAAAVPSDGARREDEGWEYNIEPDRFEMQLRCLLSLGRRFVSLEDYVATIEASGRCGRNEVVVTFDDGWRDGFDHALPILVRLGIRAAFFIVSGAVPKVAAERRLAPEHVVELCRLGMTVGAHGRTHSDLTSLEPGKAAEEMKGSRLDVEELIRRPVFHLAYPGGRFNRTIADLAQEAGFRSACCSLGGGLNDRASLFWLYRDMLSPGVNTWRDRLLLSPVGRRLLDIRARVRLQGRLGGGE